MPGKLRSQLRQDEFLNIDVKLNHMILGDCRGIGFHPRSKHDNHVMILVLTEDDGQWFVSHSKTGFSSYWLHDYCRVVKAAEEWLKDNCTPSKDGYGYTFK